MDKRIVLVLSALLLIGVVVTAFAAVPRLMNFQGVLRDSEGEPVTTTVEVVFNIWDADEEGSSVWTETRSVTPDASGKIDILLGETVSIESDVFDGDERWLGIQVEDDPEMTPRTRLASVGYAYRVLTVDGATGGNIYSNVEIHSVLSLYGGYGLTVSGTYGGAISVTDGEDATIYMEGKNEGVGAFLSMTDGTNETVHIDANGTGDAEGGAQVSLCEGDGSTSISLDAESGSYGGAHVSLCDSEQNTTISLDAEEGSDGGGIIKLYDDDGDKTVHIDAHGVTYGGAQVSLSDHGGNTTISLDAESGSGGGAKVNLTNSDGDGTIVLDADMSNTGAIVLQRPGGETTIALSAEYGGPGGDGRVTTDVLVIRGGSDLSEQFDIHDLHDGNRPSPGMVVCIDPEHPGKLVVSSEAYDPAVAGIISGAGGIKPGMLMGQSGSLSDGEYAVALTGRVYCWTDASNGTIEPGDLLTTSDIPGHAMKVTDHARAQGAIIGKAMTSLAEGKGLVLVLVSLQ